MTVPMDNSLDQSLRDRVQHLYNKNVELGNRRRRAARARIPSDPNAWQQMRENFEAIILEDHGFSEQHEIEYALWQLHYQQIEEFRACLNAARASAGSATTQSGKVPTQPDQISKIRSQLKTFLSEATGFYHELMLKIKAKHGLPLASFSDDPESQIMMLNDGVKSAKMKKGLISCHRCLIYLGDLSRYKGLYGEGESKNIDFSAASSYYMQASSLWPSNGNPHHQLAILASYSGDELLITYRYFRSLAVDNPFSTARENLILAFEKNRQSFSQLLEDAKATSMKTAAARMTGKGRGRRNVMSSLKNNKTEARTQKIDVSSISQILKAFNIRFVRLNGILFTRTSLETFEGVLSMVQGDLCKLLSSGPEEECNFGSDVTNCGLVIVRLVAILIFTVHNVNQQTENQLYAEILQHSVLLQNAFTAIFDFMGHIVERCIQLHDPLASFLLPGVLVFMEWLACHPDFAAGMEAEEKQAIARSFFWKKCISFLNKLLSSGLMPFDIDEDETCFANIGRYDEGETGNRLALWEDFELRGFAPLVPAQLILNFSRRQSYFSEGSNKLKMARLQRIVAAGKALIGVVQVGQHTVCFDKKLKKFALDVEPQTVTDIEQAAYEMSASNVLMQAYQPEDKLPPEVLPLKAQPIEGEEEEVIVFKPTVTDKNDGVNGPDLSSYDVPGGNASQGSFDSYLGSLSVQMGDDLIPNAFDRSRVPFTSSATLLTKRLQLFQPNTSKWLANSEASIANGLKTMSLTENGLVKPGLLEHIGVLQPPGPLLPSPHTLNASSGSQHSVQFSDLSVPSKFDSITSSGANLSNLSMKSSSALPVTWRIDPVSRPVRHTGPPPGFSPVVSKFIDESLSRTGPKNEIVQMDDYRWLDDYQPPSSTRGTSLTDLIIQSLQPHNYTIEPHSLIGTTSFPFPGKQLHTFQVQVESQDCWKDRQIPSHLKSCQESKQELQKLGQQSIPLPQQYLGQSLWEGRFFV